MLSAVPLTVIGLSDTMRPLLLIGFVVVMFAVAGLAVVLGRRHAAKGQERELSGDVGVLKGAGQGGDSSFDDDWFAETVAEDASEAPRHSWKDAILGPGSVHENPLDPNVLPPELQGVHGSQVPAQGDSWAPPSEVAWGETPSKSVPVQTVGNPEVEMPPTTNTSGLDSENAPEPAWGRVGKHAAPRPPDSTLTKPAPFLVDNFLDDEDEN